MTQGDDRGDRDAVRELSDQFDRAVVENLEEIATSPQAPAVAELLVRLNAGVGQTSSVRSVLTDPERLSAIEHSGLANPDSGPIVDRIVDLAIEATGADNAGVTVVTDQVQILAGVAASDDGTTTKLRHQGPLTGSICVVPVITSQPLVIDDLTEHPIFSTNDAVTSGFVRSYVGVPIADQNGRRIGALCAWHSEPHHWTPGQVQIMHDLCDMATAMIFGES